MSSASPDINRRELIKSAALLAGGAGVLGRSEREARAENLQILRFERPDKSMPCLFSKPLGNRKADELPGLLNEMGIDAVDLTCRPAGHVLPERVADDLPRTVERLGSAGISVPMITTSIIHAGEGHAEQIVATAGRLGIRYMKLGYFEYKDMRRLMQTMAEAQARLVDIAALCREHNVHAGYHLHCGRRIGGGLWDAWHLLRNTPTRDVGLYFDLRHATVEGGDAGWEIAVNLLADQTTMLALKDFVWKRDDKGRWRPDDVPLGTGMVRLDYGLEQLEQLGFAGPVSLHVEYASHQVEPGSDDEKRNLASIRQDWQSMKAALRRAGLT